MKGLTWVGNGAKLPTLVQKNAGVILTELYHKHEVNKPLIVNFQGINSISQYSLKEINDEAVQGTRTLIVINGKHLRTKLIEEFRSLGTPKVEYSEDDCIVWCQTVNHNTVKNYIEQTRKQESKHIYSLVYDCYQSWETKKRLSSTPLLANGVFDARKIISVPRDFLWLSLHLTEMLERALEDFEESDEGSIPSNLIAVSLRGSPVAAAIGLMSSRDLEIEIVDHMGPKHEILEEYSMEHGSRGVKYIYVGDFLIGGTELKTAQMYARSKGNSISHAVVIGNWLDINEHESNLGLKLISSVNLRECQPEAEMKFDPTE